MGVVIPNSVAKYSLTMEASTYQLHRQILFELRHPEASGGILANYAERFMGLDPFVISLVKDVQYNDLLHPINLELVQIVMDAAMGQDCTEIYVDTARNVYYVQDVKFLYEIPLHVLTLDFSFNKRVINRYLRTDSVQNMSIYLRHSPPDERQQCINITGKINRVENWLIRLVIASRLGVVSHGPNLLAEMALKLKSPKIIVLES